MQNKNTWNFHTELGDEWFAKIEDGKIHFNGSDPALDEKTLSFTPHEAEKAIELYHRDNGFANKWIVSEAEFCWFKAVILVALPIISMQGANLK